MRSRNLNAEGSWPKNVEAELIKVTPLIVPMKIAEEGLLSLVNQRP
jgi:hypothetical protein